MGCAMRKSLRAGILGTIMAVVSALPAAALPIAMYDATINATLSLVGVSVEAGTGDADVDISGEAFVILDDDFASGDASSSASGDVSPKVFSPLATEPITIDISAGGAATGIGFAESFLFSEGFVDLINYSPDNTVKLDFELDYSLSAAASVTDPLLQAASGNAFLSLQSSQETDPLLEFDLLADTDLLEAGGSIADIFAFSIFLAPEDFAFLTILADASGALTSDLTAPVTEIPIPSMAALFGLGAFGLLFKRRRQGSKAVTLS